MTVGGALWGSIGITATTAVIATEAVLLTDYGLDANGYPTIGTLIVVFAGLVALKGLSQFWKMWADSIRRESLPGQVKTLQDSLEGLVRRFDAHVEQETRQWEKIGADMNAHHGASMEMLAGIQTTYESQMDGMRKSIDAMEDRRKGSRG